MTGVPSAAAPRQIAPNTWVGSVKLVGQRNQLIFAGARIGAPAGYSSVDVAKDALRELTGERLPAAVLVAEDGAIHAYSARSMRTPLFGFSDLRPFGLQLNQKDFRFRHPDVVGLVDGSMFVPRTS